MNLSRTINFAAALFLVMGGCLMFFNFAFTATESGNINVQMTVPSTGGGGSPTIPPDSTGPSITDVTSTIGYTTGTVSWTATDISFIQNCNFNYGLTELYGLPLTPVQSGSSYSVNFTGLATATPYYYQISCFDTFYNMSTVTGTFVTEAPGFTRKLFILAKPEKRVPKTGGNWGANATLLLYHSVTKDLMYSKAIVLSGAGTSTLQDSGIPTGNFEAVIKGESHLAKKIINVSISNSMDTTMDFTESNVFYLFAGDVQGAGLKDNFVDILDISAENIKLNSHDQIFDINRDNIVDVLDMSAVLVNYNKSGDDI